MRSAGEYLSDDGAYLYDTAAGGAGVCELLLDPANGYAHFGTAIEVAALAQCSCEDGCPQCLFQYGCSERNQPASLSRRALLDLLAGGLRLESPDRA